MVKALLNLRTQMTKDERLEAIVICKEVLDSFKGDEVVGKRKTAIFDKLDTTEAEKADKLYDQH